MNTRQLSRAIAQRLPTHTQDDVETILTSFTEVVEEELARGGYIYLHGLGRLHINYHFLHPSGVFQGRYNRSWTLLRLYFRFTPTRDLKDTVRSAIENSEGQG
jgi:nucleoid DNA-binding protein